MLHLNVYEWLKRKPEIILESFPSGGLLKACSFGKQTHHLCRFNYANKWVILLFCILRVKYNARRAIKI